MFGFFTLGSFRLNIVLLLVFAGSEEELGVFDDDRWDSDTLTAQLVTWVFVATTGDSSTIYPERLINIPIQSYP